MVYIEKCNGHKHSKTRRRIHNTKYTCLNIDKMKRERERIPENGLGKARYEHERKPSPFLHNGLMENQVVFLFADITMVMIGLKVALQFYRENVSFS